MLNGLWLNVFLSKQLIIANEVSYDYNFNN